MSATNEPESPPANAFPIDLSPLSDPEAIAARDREWLDKVYARGVPQLTVRAAVTGMLLGSILGASNLYIGLKIGWNFGMSITASVLAFAIFSAVRKVIPGMSEFTMLENNTSQTAASAAAYMSSAGLVSSIPALTMLRREHVINVPELTPMQLTFWLLAISVLGVVVAIPLKRNLINAEQLRFPSGIVCAETIRTMHAAGKESLAKARSLLVAGLFAAVMKFIFDCKLWLFRRLPETVGLPFMVRGYPAESWSFALNTSLLLYAAGAIVGLKVALSLAVGSAINYGFIGPWLLDHDVLRVATAADTATPVAWQAFVRAAEHDHAIPVRSAAMLHAVLRSKWSVWPGTSVMVSASLVAFAFRWRTIARAFSGLGKVFALRKKRPTVEPVVDHAYRANQFEPEPPPPPAEDALADVEVPSKWFGVGLALCTVASIVMLKAWFGVPIFEGVLAVALAFVLSVVAARATGETDVTPIGAMGKIAQLLFGVLVPGNAAANLMTATVTAGAAAHSADLLTEVKTGYLLGGAPRKQFWAQILGVVAGAFVCVPAYFLIAKPERLGNDLAAPAAVAWASVAKLLKDGPGNLPRYAIHAIVAGAALGVVLAVAEEFAPKKWKAYLPSATGLGIAMVIDFNDSFAMLVGAVIAWVLHRTHKDFAERYIVSASSGVVAGEGLMGIVVIVLRDIAHVLPG